MPQAKSIYVIDANTGDIVHECETASHAAEFAGVKRGTVVNILRRERRESRTPRKKTLRHKTRTGYTFAYADNHKQIQIQMNHRWRCDSCLNIIAETEYRCPMCGNINWRIASELSVPKDIILKRCIQGRDRASNMIKAMTDEDVRNINDPENYSKMIQNYIRIVKNEQKNIRKLSKMKNHE